MYEYHWLPGTLVQPGLLDEFSKLYSQHYGIWGKLGPRPGKSVRLTPEKLRDWIRSDSLVVWATAFGELIGYAIAAQAEITGRGTVSWVTQLVVHEEHRQQDVGKLLLFTIWRFTDHFAWGLLSANPYAIRALEKATRRRCEPSRILADVGALARLGQEVVPYISADTPYVVNETASMINTEFFLDHSQLPAMLASATSEEKPWRMGGLSEGWEWFAFTFTDQAQLSLSQREVTEMLAASDLVTKEAYSRMAIAGSAQAWAKHQVVEAAFIVQTLALRAEDSILDFGCGQGRHAKELAALGLRATGVDYVSAFIEAARTNSPARSPGVADFVLGDCRTIDLAREFDAGICLYDVVGTYVDENDNFAVLTNLARHVKPSGLLLLSVMNMELTERLARHSFSISSEPDKLLTMKPSRIMETTGNVFDPEFYLIDRDTRIVYRKEQFIGGEGLPEEFIVRDRRYTKDGIRTMCEKAGLQVLWSRFVQSGRWDTPLPAESPKAKEILVLCRKPALQGAQGLLFE